MPFSDNWPGLALAAIPALVGYGDLRARATQLSKDVDTKASKEVVNTQYDEILRRLDRIENRVNRVHREGD